MNDSDEIVEQKQEAVSLVNEEFLAYCATPRRVVVRHTSANNMHATTEQEYHDSQDGPNIADGKMKGSGIGGG
jgi:hypothetical protein